MARLRHQPRPSYRFRTAETSSDDRSCTRAGHGTRSTGRPNASLRRGAWLPPLQHPKALCSCSLLHWVLLPHAAHSSAPSWCRQSSREVKKSRLHAAGCSPHVPTWAANRRGRLASSTASSANTVYWNPEPGPCCRGTASLNPPRAQICARRLPSLVDDQIRPDGVQQVLHAGALLRTWRGLRAGLRFGSSSMSARITLGPLVPEQRWREDETAAGPLRVRLHGIRSTLGTSHAATPCRRHQVSPTQPRRRRTPRSSTATPRTPINTA